MVLVVPNSHPGQQCPTGPVLSTGRGRLARGALTESFGCVQEHTGLRGSMVLVLQETREAAVPGRVTLLPFPHPVKESQSCCEL